MDISLKIEGVSIVPKHFLARLGGIPPNVGLPDLMMGMGNDGGTIDDVIFNGMLKIFSSIKQLLTSESWYRYTVLKIYIFSIEIVS